MKPLVFMSCQGSTVTDTNQISFKQREHLLLMKLEYAYCHTTFKLYRSRGILLPNTRSVKIIEDYCFTWNFSNFCWTTPSCRATRSICMQTANELADPTGLSHACTGHKYGACSDTWNVLACCKYGKSRPWSITTSLLHNISQIVQNGKAGVVSGVALFIFS